MYCRNCGKLIKFNDYFCEYCGERTDIVDDVKTKKEKKKHL